MSRVMLFFDGKNHIKDLRRVAPDRWIDHTALAQWAVDMVGGDELVGAHYYTGVSGAGERPALEDLLAELESKRGFFVHRFPRRTAKRTCQSCHVEQTYTEEKRVDTSLVADVVMHAAKGNYDIAVVFSADADVAPALSAAREFGCRAWVATFNSVPLTRTLVQEAWDTLDLGQHLEAFAHPELMTVASPALDVQPVVGDAEVLRELRRAEETFGVHGGFVGAHYFVHRWKGVGMPENPDDRRASIQRLIDAGLAELYDHGGTASLRVVGAVDAQSVATATNLPIEDVPIDTNYVDVHAPTES